MQRNQKRLSNNAVRAGISDSIEPACWFRVMQKHPPVRTLQHPAYRLSKDVRILSIIVAELKFVQIERQILLAHLVVRADYSALQERQNDSILLVCTSPRTYSYCHGALSYAESFLEQAIIPVLIGRDERDFNPAGLSNEPDRKSKRR